MTVTAEKKSTPKRKPGKSIMQVGPLDVFTAPEVTAKFFMWLSLFLIVCLVVEPVAILAILNTQNKTLFYDKSGNFYLAETRNFDDDKDLVRYISELSAEAMLSVNPDGYNYKNRLKKLYLPGVLKEVIGMEDELKPKFASLKMHQNVEIQETKILQSRSDHILVDVSGQLFIDFIFEGQGYTENPRFKVRFTLVPNPNTLSRGRYPYAVSKLNGLRINYDEFLGNVMQLSDKDPAAGKEQS